MMIKIGGRYQKNQVEFRIKTKEIDIFQNKTISSIGSTEGGKNQGKFHSNEIKSKLLGVTNAREKLK